MKQLNLKKFLSISLLVLLNFLFVPTTSAAAVTGLSDTLSRLKAGQAANHTIVFTTPTGIVATNTITLTFLRGRLRWVPHLLELP